MTSHAPPKQPGVRFGLFGFPVTVDASFFLISGLLAAQRLAGSTGWQGFLSWFVAVFVSILVHELGHAVAFRRFGLQPDITLYSMGGLTSARGRLTWGRSLITSLAGPLTGMAFGGVVLVLQTSGTWSVDTLFEAVLYDDLLFVNFLWGLLNLVPLHPLDGGQSLEALLHLRKVKNVVRKVSIVSISVAGLGVFYGVATNRTFLALIAGYFGYQNIQRLQAAQPPPPPTGPATPGPPPGPRPDVA